MAAIKVTSTKSISFPKLNWGINAGSARELPDDKDAQSIILAHPAITEVKGGSANQQKPVKDSDDQKPAKDGN